jgi:pimeloyl-ACP methyl ester carboxylesterase
MTPRQTGLADRRGCPLAYAVEGDGPPVLMVHGTGLHGEGWRPQIDGLRSSYRCATLDNRGIGGSLPQGDAPITVAEMALDALAVLDALGWDRAHLVGHSLGGCVAAELAIRAPERVASLALMCTAARGRDLVGLDLAMLWTGVRCEIGTLRSRRRAFLELLLTPAAHRATDLDALAAELEPLFGQDLARRPPIAMAQLGAMRGWDGVAGLRAMSPVPSLVVGAAFDRIARPATIRALIDALPGCRPVLLADAAHGAPITHAAVVNAALEEHLAGAS